MVEAHGPQGEGPGQKTHVCEQNPDGVLEGGEFLEDRGRLDQLPVCLRLLDLDKTGQQRWLGLGGESSPSRAKVSSHWSRKESVLFVTIIWSDSV